MIDMGVDDSIGIDTFKGPATWPTCSLWVSFSSAWVTPLPSADRTRAFEAIRNTTAICTIFCYGRKALSLRGVFSHSSDHRHCSIAGGAAGAAASQWNPYAPLACGWQ